LQPAAVANRAAAITADGKNFRAKEQVSVQSATERGRMANASLGSRSLSTQLW
jgi:hypothetical protein